MSEEDYVILRGPSSSQAGSDPPRLTPLEGYLLAALELIRLYSRCNDTGNYPGIFRVATEAIAKTVKP